MRSQVRTGSYPACTKIKIYIVYEEEKKNTCKLIMDTTRHKENWVMLLYTFVYRSIFNRFVWASCCPFFPYRPCHWNRPGLTGAVGWAGSQVNWCSYFLFENWYCPPASHGKLSYFYIARFLKLRFEIERCGKVLQWFKFSNWYLFIWLKHCARQCEVMHMCDLQFIFWEFNMPTATNR